MGGILVRTLVAALALGAAACGGAEAEQAPRPTQASVPAGWSTLPAPPSVRFRGTAVWTGSELLYWGGESGYGDEVHADGAAFDPLTGAWRPLASAPLSPRRGAAGVWTGSEMLVWGGAPTSGGEGAAYDPGRDVWRRLPDSPIDPRAPVGAVWTGAEMIVWGSDSRTASAVDGAAYDPGEDRWRRLPPAPFALNEATLAWTGAEMIAVGARLDHNNWSDTEHARATAFDPVKSEWRILPSYPFSPQASTAVWTGRELVVWDYELRAAAYDPAANRWRPLPDLPLDFFECYPQGAAGAGLVFAWHCGRAALLDLESGAWSEVPGAPPDIFGPPVAAGPLFLFVGAHGESGGDSAWAYRPS